MSVSKHIISQYDGKDKLHAVVDLFQSVLQASIGDQAGKLLGGMTSKATGYWLELMGKRFALSRPVLPSAEVPKFFGLVEGVDGDPTFDDTGKATFTRAPFVPDGQGGGLQGMVMASDEAYADLINMKVGSLRTDGSQDDVNIILNGIFTGSYVLDNQDMTISVFINSNGSQNDVKIIMNNPDLIPRPVGVSMTLSEYEGAFGYDGAGTGFDQRPYKE